MKSFKQFLYEMPISSRESPDETHHYIDSNDEEHQSDHNEQHLGNIRGYNIVGSSWSKKIPFTEFTAKHEVTGEHHFRVSSQGNDYEDGHFKAAYTQRHSQAKITGPEFYKAILRSGKVKGIRSDDEHTDGGKSIWKRLSHDPEVEVTHHDSETGKQIKLHKGDDWGENYDHPNKTHFRVRLKNEKL